MTAISEFEPKKVMEAVAELKTAVETKNVEAEAKITAFLNEQESKNQEIVLSNSKLQNELKTAQERLEALEKSAAKPDFKGDRKSQLDAEVKSLESFLIKGRDGLTADEIKGLSTLVDADGGYLVPQEMANDLIKNITEISPLRSLATVRTIRGKALSVPKRTSLVTAYWTDEGQDGTLSNSKYGLETIPLNKMTAYIETTREALEDTGVSLESWINQDVREELGRLEGAAFVSGDSVNKPEGFSNATTQGSARNSGEAADVTIDSILLVAGDLKTGYNPVYAMNRTTMAAVRVKKAGDGHYLWVAGNIAAGVPNTINGYGYVELPNMDDIAANAYPIAFSDFRQGYMIVDKPELLVIRDIYSKAKSNKIDLVFHKRTGGGMVKSEAIKLIKCAV